VSRIVQGLKEKNLTTKNSIGGKAILRWYVVELSFKNEERKTFSDKQQPVQLITSRSVPQEMLKGIIKAEKKENQALTESCMKK